MRTIRSLVAALPFLARANEVFQKDVQPEYLDTAITKITNLNSLTDEKKSPYIGFDNKNEDPSLKKEVGYKLRNLLEIAEHLEPITIGNESIELINKLDGRNGLGVFLRKTNNLTGEQNYVSLPNARTYGDQFPKSIRLVKEGVLIVIYSDNHMDDIIHLYELKDSGVINIPLNNNGADYINGLPLSNIQPDNPITITLNGVIESYNITQDGSMLEIENWQSTSWPSTTNESGTTSPSTNNTAADAPDKNVGETTGALLGTLAVLGGAALAITKWSKHQQRKSAADLLDQHQQQQVLAQEIGDIWTVDKDPESFSSTTIALDEAMHGKQDEEARNRDDNKHGNNQEQQATEDSVTENLPNKSSNPNSFNPNPKSSNPLITPYSLTIVATSPVMGQGALSSPSGSESDDKEVDADEYISEQRDLAFRRKESESLSKYLETAFNADLGSPTSPNEQPSSKPSSAPRSPSLLERPDLRNSGRS